jgi:DUF971 family protein
MSHEGIRFVPKDQPVQEGESDRPLPRVAVTPQKVRVLITENKGLEIDWADGHKSAWSFAWLREACPCAICNEQRRKDGRQIGQPKAKAALQMFTPPPKPASAQAVGHYAIRFEWLDGHSGGIYSWEHLRRICQCAACASAEAGGPDAPNPAPSS